MKAAKLFFAVIFIMALSFGARAQDKYEYATVVYKRGTAKKGIISLSIQGKYTTTETEITEGYVSENLSPLMEALNKLSTEGWEVYNSNVTDPEGVYFHIYYHLKRKKG